MWNYFTTHWNESQTINLKESYYCGNRGGRSKTITEKADKNAADYEFATNVGINFCTPEMLFLNLNDRIPRLEFEIEQSKCLNDEEMFIKNE